MSNKSNVTGAALKSDAVLSRGESYKVALSELPVATIVALAQRGFTHILGNEVAAYESGLKAARVESAPGVNVAKYNDAEIATMAHDRRMAKIDEMIAGELGTRAVGPRLPKLERIMRDYAKEVIIAAFTARKMEMPKASDSDAWNTIVDKYLAVPSNYDKAKAEAQSRMDLEAAAAGADLSWVADAAKAG